MRRAVLVLVVFLGLVSAAGAFWALMGLQQPAEPEQDASPAVTAKAPTATAKAPTPDAAPQDNQPEKELPAKSKSQSQQQPAEKSESPFDIAKVDPGGVSVFAGRAEPNGHVTVFADGKAVGTANTDPFGEWVLVTEDGISSDDPNLTVMFKTGTAAVTDTSRVAAQASTPEENDRPDSQAQTAGQTAATVTADLVGDLRRLVDKARAEKDGAALPEAIDKQTLSFAAHQLPSAAPASSEAVSAKAVEHAEDAAEPASDEVAAVVPKPDLSVNEEKTPKAELKSVPVPIKFVFNEAVLTKDGRETAELLAEYVLLKKFSSLELTGHADERGQHKYNLALSSERLQQVAAMLRKAGYSGKLRLVPKGETEPFSGVDRSQFSQDVLYELDRRVEIRTALP